MEQHVVRRSCSIFICLRLEVKPHSGQLEPYTITVHKCWTKPFDNSLLNRAQVQIPRSLGSPACGWLHIPKLAGYDCLAQVFTSLMHMNCSRAPASMLMSVLVCSEASHRLLIKLILVENAGRPGRRAEEDRVAPFGHVVSVLDFSPHSNDRKYSLCTNCPASKLTKRRFFTNALRCKKTLMFCV